MPAGRAPVRPHSQVAGSLQPKRGGQPPDRRPACPCIPGEEVVVDGEPCVGKDGTVGRDVPPIDAGCGRGGRGDEGVVVVGVQRPLGGVAEGECVVLWDGGDVLQDITRRWAFGNTVLERIKGIPPSVGIALGKIFSGGNSPAGACPPLSSSPISVVEADIAVSGTSSWVSLGGCRLQLYNREYLPLPLQKMQE